MAILKKKKKKKHEPKPWAYIVYGFCIEVFMFLEDRHFQGGWWKRSN